MALDRWIALVFVAFCCVYGYAAFFTMDHLLPPILQRNPVWPSTFPKILAILGIGVGLMVLLTKAPAKKDGEVDEAAMSIKRLGEYHMGQALALVGLMIAYALLLRPLGFLASTILFLTIGATILGERKYYILIPVAAIATFGIWYLVQEVLGIFLRPLPSFF